MWKVSWPEVLAPVLAAALSAVPPAVLADVCFPTLDKTVPQYVIGYGSLLQEQTVTPASIASGSEIPVWVDGFRRGWLTRTRQDSFVRLTELGVVPFIGDRFNGILVAMSPGAIKGMDRHQPRTCRIQVNPAQLTAMNDATMPANGQFWIYQTRANYIKKPAGSYPILMSEVDQFLTGCIELGQQFAVESFAADCVATTWDWSVHWVNDRYYPLRGRPVQIKSQQVDQLLESQLGTLFEQVNSQ